MAESESPRALSEPPITLVLPYFNEAGYIAATLESLAVQTDRRFALVLVDNASTDNSAKIARQSCKGMLDVSTEFMTEEQAGKIFALRSGIAAVRTRYVATLDADTIYPVDYVARMLREFEEGENVAAVLAFDLPAGAEPVASSKQRLFADFLPSKCHTGGFGQAFDASKLAECGGFDPELWPYVLEDHEIIHRIGKLGRLAYAADHICYPSDRRNDRSDCSWTFAERVLYKVMPASVMDWLFYKFLAGRFERRGLRNIKLRDQGWQNSEESIGAG